MATVFPIDYGRAVGHTGRLERQVVNRLSADTLASRRTVLGRLGVVGNRTPASVGRSLASSSDGHDDGGDFEAVGEYVASRFDPIGSFETRSQFADDCFKFYMKFPFNSRTATEVARTRNPAAALEVAP